MTNEQKTADIGELVKSARNQLALIHSLANDITEANWDDKRLHVLQTCVRQSDALTAIEARCAELEKERDFEQSSRLTSEAQLGTQIGNLQLELATLRDRIEREPVPANADEFVERFCQMIEPPLTDREKQIAAMAMGYAVASAPERVEAEPVFYAVMDKTGAAVLDEYCVSADADELRDAWDERDGYTVVPLYASPPAPVVTALEGKYGDVLRPFVAMMEAELDANSGKGDRPGWLEMDRKTALLEIFYHLAKLQKATKDDDQSGIREYGADVANMAMMLVDICGSLDAEPALASREAT